jgi:hypothetical protein
MLTSYKTFNVVHRPAGDACPLLEIISVLVALLILVYQSWGVDE